MSSVRMCDVCGNIFSEAEPNWQTGRIATVGEDGIEKIVTQDRCPDCAVGVKGKPKMRPRIAVDVPPQPTLESAKEVVERQDAAKTLGEIVDAHA